MVVRDITEEMKLAAARHRLAVRAGRDKPRIHYPTPL